MSDASSTKKYRVTVPNLNYYQELISCRYACPVRTDVKGYVSAVAEGNYEKAYSIARQANPLVSICGRICQAPCERACRRSEADDPVAIRALKRFACERYGVESGTGGERGLQTILQEGPMGEDRLCNDLYGILELASFNKTMSTETQQVAIIGSGPSGLAAAHDLALLGYRVTIFEESTVPGGMLRMGIPEFRLPADLIQREINAILDLGVTLNLNSPIGQGRSLADLMAEGYRAIYIAIGLQEAPPLTIQGSELKGVHGGITYLRWHSKIPVGTTCIVIGGGGVAIDCAQLALRQGATNVRVACLESWEEMPAGIHEKLDALEEGIQFFPSLGPKRIVGRGDNVAGVEFLKVDSVFDEQGNFNPRLRQGTESYMDTDTVLLAIGQSPNLSVLHGMSHLTITPRGLITVDEDLSTNVRGVFAGGDIVSGPRGVVDAIAHGQKAAQSIHRFLSGKSLSVATKGSMKVLAPSFENRDYDRIKIMRPPKRPAGKRITDYKEIDLPYQEQDAKEQARRCVQCHIQTVFNRALCILCGTCVDSCPKNAYKMVRFEDLEGDTGFEQLKESLDCLSTGLQERTAIIKDEARCMRCGCCAKRCPTGAITMEAFTLKEVWTHE